MTDSRSFRSKEALFRFCIVNAVRAYIAQGLPRSAAVRTVAEISPLLCEPSRQVSLRTVQRWFALFLKHGVDGLEPRKRASLERGSMVLSDQLLAFFDTQRTLDPGASIPDLIELARAEDIIGEDTPIDRSTVWRAFRRMGIETRHTRAIPGDTRRFAFSEPMQMVMADFTYFRAGPTRVRRIALYIIDDATWYVLGVVVGTGGEALDTFLHAIHRVLRTYGRFSVLYLDNGPAFKADDLGHVMANLNIARVNGRARYPQARGKVERFNRSVKKRLLRALAGADIDTSAEALTLRLAEDVKHYNNRPHEGLGGDTPQSRWTRGRALRPIPEETLREAFVLPVERKVTNDHTISFGGVRYEVPAGNAGKRVTFERHLLEDNRLYISTPTGAVRLHEVDQQANATARRGGRNEVSAANENPQTAPPKTAAMSRFEQDFAPVTDQDGGFSEPTDKRKEH